MHIAAVAGSLTLYNRWTGTSANTQHVLSYTGTPSLARDTANLAEVPYPTLQFVAAQSEHTLPLQETTKLDY